MDEKPKLKTALVADDEPMMLRLCQAVLADLGYEVLKAASGEDALKILAERGRDVTLLITDIVMTSQTDGIDLGNQAGARYPHIQVIYMSGYAHGGAVSELLEDKSTLFLRKPFIVSKLVDIVKKAEAGNSPD